MKRKIALIVLSLVLVLGGLMPATVAAAKPNDTVAVGYISAITDTELGVNVYPAGRSGRWRVVERTISGVFYDGIVGPFTLTYNANVDALQAGNLHGTLTAGGYEIEVNGQSEAAAFYGSYELFPGYWVPLYEIGISGHWAVTKGGKGNGDFTASLVFIPTPDGQHVYAVIPPYSGVTLTGSLD